MCPDSPVGGIGTPTSSGGDCLPAEGDTLSTQQESRVLEGVRALEKAKSGQRERSAGKAGLLEKAAEA